MNERIIEIKQQCSGKQHIFATVISDDIVIPWRLLSIKDYLYYSDLITFQQTTFPIGVYENEIFCKCVIDPSWVRRINYINAGIVTTVVQNIMDYSIPSTAEIVSHDLTQMRIKLSNGPTKVLHDFVNTILLAFPVGPDKVYNLTWEELLHWVILAEQKLMTLGVLENPITIQSNNEVYEAPDPKALWEQQRKRPSNPVRQKPPTNFNPNISPVLQCDPPDIDFRSQHVEQSLGMDNWDKIDMDITSHQMVEEAKDLYKDVLEGLAQQRQAGKFKTPQTKRKK